MKVDGFSNANVQESSVRFESEKERARRRLGSRCYIVKSSLGTFLALTFIDALCLAKKIFTINGCWALIKL